MPVSQNKVVTTQALRTADAITVAAKTTYGDAANAVKLTDAGPNGSVLYGLKAYPRATITATQLQLYRSPDNGVTLFLIAGPVMGAYTMAQITAVPGTDLGYSEGAPLRLKIGDSLWVAMGVALAGGVSWDANLEDL